MFKICYGMEMKKRRWKVEKKTYVVDAKGMVHATWKVNGSKMSEECRHLEGEDSQDKTRRRRTNLPKISLNLRRVTLLQFQSNVSLQYPSSSLYRVEGRSFKGQRKKQMKRNCKFRPKQVTPILENVTFLLLLFYVLF